MLVANPKTELSSTFLHIAFGLIFPAIGISWIFWGSKKKKIGKTSVPFLVYEFFTDKTLYDSIHDEFSFLSWERRLKIATETAGSLLYLHSGGETPIIHGNIDSSNILLDHGFMGHISDSPFKLTYWFQQ
ncbi:unnamed protein product [Fraxinus pennsylvanica]|uniref:Protein kinase domain-containing protein n=1 Tax=Fraxinus pennsylvanica TaxID=56036 RepID=A0AAD2AEH0_9LAMI|nr:unnamed protein product [Fraxinus pennsylvanica]